MMSFGIIVGSTEPYLAFKSNFSLLKTIEKRISYSYLEGIVDLISYFTKSINQSSFEKVKYCFVGNYFKFKELLYSRSFVVD